MASETKIRELQETVHRLSKMLEDGIASKNRIRSFFSPDVGGEVFYDRISAYHINHSSNEDLENMIANLQELKSAMSTTLTELRRGIDWRGTKDVRQYVEAEEVMHHWYDERLTMMGLDSGEVERRKAFLKLDIDEAPRDYRLKIREEIKRIEQDIRAAEKMMVVNNNPDLLGTYDRLLDVQEILDDELEYRDETRIANNKYKSLYNIYRDIESIFQELENFEGSDARRNSLERRKSEAIELLGEYVDGEVLDTLKGVSQKELMEVLKVELECAAFEINALNGRVDRDVLTRDLKDVRKVGIYNVVETNHQIDLELQKLEHIHFPDEKGANQEKEALIRERKALEASLQIPTQIKNTLEKNLRELKKKEEELKKQEEALKKDPNAKKEEIAAKEKELNDNRAEQNKVQKGIDKRNKKIKKTREKMAELYDRIGKMPDEVGVKSKEQEALERKKEELKNKKLNVQGMKTDEMKKYEKMLQLKSLTSELSTILKAQKELESLMKRYRELSGKKDLTQEEKDELAAIEGQIKSIRKNVNRISVLTNSIKKLADELGIPDIMNIEGGNLSSDLLDSVAGTLEDEMKAQKDEAIRKREGICKKYGIDPTLTTKEILDAMNAKVKEIESEPKVRSSTSELNDETPQFSGRNQTNPDVSAPSSSTAVPKPNATVTPFRADNVPSSMPQNSFGRSAAQTPTMGGNNREATSTSTSNLAPSSKILQTFKVEDAQLQLDTTEPAYKRRIENAKVYRYVRGKSTDELHLIEEDLDLYLDNPKKKLETTLDDLRGRMMEELGGEEGLKRFCRENPNNEILAGLIDKSPLKRSAAKRKFMKKIRECNHGGEELAYANMAIALKSEIYPEGIVDVLNRKSQPYVSQSDAIHYVKKKEVFGKTKLVVDREKIELMKKAEMMKAERGSRTTRTQSDTIVRPFRDRANAPEQQKQSQQHQRDLHGGQKGKNTTRNQKPKENEDLDSI